MSTTLIAHRCGPDIYPEQSIASARHALALGADYVEMDIQYTCDGCPVICHDPNTLRIFGVDKLCRDMTLDEFMSLRHVKDRSYPSHSLRDVLGTEVRPLLLHCKISGEPLKDLVRCILDHNAQHECVIGVLYAEDVELIKSICGDIRTLAFMPKLEQLQGFLQSKVDIIRLWEDWVNEERVQMVRKAGKQLWIMAGKATAAGVGYTTEEKMHYWMRLGVDGILVNDVRWARKIIDDTLHQMAAQGT